MEKKATTWVISVALPTNWIPGTEIEQFEYEYPEGKELTYDAAMFAAKSFNKKWRKFKVVGVIKKG